AGATGATAGRLVALSEQSYGSMYYYDAASPDDVCVNDVPRYQGGPLPMSNPDVRVSTTVYATYALGDGAAGPGQGLSTYGTGQATARAQRADIVISTSGIKGEGAPEPVTSPGPGQLTPDQKERAISRIAALGIDRAAIHVDVPPYSGQVQVVVSVAPEQVAGLGGQLAAVVEDEL